METVTQEHLLIPAIVDRKGDVAVDKPFPLEWSQALFGVPSLEQFRNRQRMVVDDILIPRHDSAARGYVDASNHIVIPGARFGMMGVFAEGRAPVQISSQGPSAGQWGYIDTRGEIAVESRFAVAGTLSEGLAAVRDQVGRTGYIRQDGAWAVEPLWLEERHPFSDGRARVKINSHFGYLDAGGRFVIPPKYLRADDFREGLAATALPAPTKTAASETPAAGRWYKNP